MGQVPFLTSPTILPLEAAEELSTAPGSSPASLLAGVQTRSLRAPGTGHGPRNPGPAPEDAPGGQGTTVGGGELRLKRAVGSSAIPTDSRVVQTRGQAWTSKPKTRRDADGQTVEPPGQRESSSGRRGGC